MSVPAQQLFIQEEAVLGVWRWEENKKKTKKTFPSKCKHEALADLRSTVIAGFGFPQSSFLEILDGAE